MESNKKEEITIQTTVKAPLEKVWRHWTEPTHIQNWNFASDNWHTTSAQNDLRVGGKFLSRMEAKDASFGFDFGGTYDEVRMQECIAYTLDDGRKVKTIFLSKEDEIQIITQFEAENTHTIQQQQQGWKAILDNFKKYTEAAL